MGKNEKKIRMAIEPKYALFLTIVGIVSLSAWMMNVVSEGFVLALTWALISTIIFFGTLGPNSHKIHNIYKKL